MNELNLITPEEKFEQNTTNLFKILNIIFISLLLVTIGVSVFSYRNNQSLSSQKAILVSRIDALKNEISGYSSEELLLRNLDIKYSTYSATNKSKVNYAEIIKEIYIRTEGTTLVVKDIVFTQGKNEVSVKVITEADQFTKFVSNMKTSEFKDSKYPNLFTPSDKNEEVNQATKEYIVYVNFNPTEIK
jgi:hypothetical protein